MLSQSVRARMLIMLQITISMSVLGVIFYQLMVLFVGAAFHNNTSHVLVLLLSC